MKIKLQTLLTAFLSIILLTGCGVKGGKDVLVTVNDIAITKGEYEKEFNKVAENPMFKQMGVDLKSNPDGYMNLMVKDRVINEMIVRALLEDAFKKNNIKISDADVEKELKNIIDKVGSKEKFNEILKQNGISNSQFKQDLKEEVKIKKLVESLSLTKITDEMAQKFYNENTDKFKYPDKVKASHILISTDKNRIKEIILAKEENKDLSDAEVEKKVDEELQARLQKAQKLLNEAKLNPANFAQLAKDNSDDPGSAVQGGDLGYFTKDQMVPEFSKAAFSARPSVVTGLVKTDYGYHIILVKDRIAAGTEPYEKVKDDIKTYLDNKEKMNVLQSYIRNARNSAKIEYVDSSFNPDEIQKQIKEQTKNNPELNKMINGEKK
ncbi:MAG: peptidylprolyl isomerase [Candidatus Gastranaerophilales bacterium]|nr:peptidylprolyl isomerase [Candidatus Gastranaerophilales bacterium]